MTIRKTADGRTIQGSNLQGVSPICSFVRVR